MAKKKEETADVDVRGQITIPLEGQEYTLRPSYEAIKRIEELTGKDHAQLAHEAVQQRLSYTDMGIICAELMRAHGKACPDDPLRSSHVGAKPETVEKLIYETGKTRIAVRLAVVLVASLSGGYTREGELTAAGN